MAISVSIIIVALLIGGYLAFSKKLAKSSSWAATVTPLASIMGSGFLVSAPLLGGTVGHLAIFCMAALLVLAFAIGHAIRFNIKHFEPLSGEAGVAQQLSAFSRIVLAGAYFISVTYYLQLLSAFVLNILAMEGTFLADMLTTVLLLIIGTIGVTKGLKLLEKMERYAVALNLGMVAALLVGLLLYNLEQLKTGQWQLAELPADIGSAEMRIVLGLLIVVQGFETSRYLGDGHSAAERIKTMRWAQLISSGIYILFLALVGILYQPGMTADVTTIIKLAAPVAIVLPVLLTVAAMGSQFSAAVADTEGAGGLVREISHKKLPIKWAYALITVVTIALTWACDVNSIISYASRAFALYYMLQCLIALVVSRHIVEPRRKQALFALLALICFIVFVLGTSVE